MPWQSSFCTLLGHVVFSGLPRFARNDEGGKRKACWPVASITSQGPFSETAGLATLRFGRSRSALYASLRGTERAVAVQFLHAFWPRCFFLDCRALLAMTKGDKRKGVFNETTGLPTLRFGRSLQ